MQLPVRSSAFGLLQVIEQGNVLWVPVCIKKDTDDTPYPFDRI